MESLSHYTFNILKLISLRDITRIKMTEYSRKSLNDELSSVELSNYDRTHCEQINRMKISITAHTMDFNSSIFCHKNNRWCFFAVEILQIEQMKKKKISKCDLCNHVVTSKWILTVNKCLSMYPQVVFVHSPNT